MRKEVYAMSEYISPVLSEIGSNSHTHNLVADQVVWYVVAIVILVALAVIIVAACVLFCIAKGKTFTGSYSYVNNKHDVRIGCN